MTAVQAFIGALRERGVDFIATLCGHGLDPLFRAATEAGMRLVDVRNEQTAGYIADTYGKLTRKPGVCAVSSGVAHANALTGVLNSWFDDAPVLLISGSAALRTAGMGHFQDVDQVAMAAPITRFSRVIDSPDRVIQLLDEALHYAAGPPPGPVHLMFPMDIQQAETSPDRIIRPVALANSSSISDPEPIAAALANAERPLIIAGSGVWYRCESEELMNFCERFSVPVVVPIWDRGSILRPIHEFMGVIGAATGGPKLLSDADCVILAGAKPDYRVGYMQSDVAYLNMDGGWRELAEAYERHGGRSHAAWTDEAAKRRDAFREHVRAKGEEQARRGLHAIHIVSELRKVMTDDTLFLVDGGSIGQWAHQLLCDHYPGHWLTCGRSGVVGWGLGGAMGARLAYPERPIILLSGDGAFTFTVAELECAVRQKLPFVVIVADDQAWGITQAGHMRQFGQAISSSLGPIAFDRLAESLGARGVTAVTPEALRHELQRALDERQVTVIHVPIVGGNP